MTRLLSYLVTLVIGGAVALFVGVSMLPNMMLKEIPSPLGFEETLEQVEANAKGMGWKVPKKWKANFQRNFQKIVGVDIGPNKLLKMCEPKAAASILKHDEYKKLSVMMPCTIAVYEKSDGKTYISVMNLKFMSMMYGGDVAAIMDEIQPQMEQMVKLTAAPPAPAPAEAVPPATEPAAAQEKKE